MCSLDCVQVFRLFFSLCSVHVLYNCVHNMHDDTSTHVDSPGISRTWVDPKCGQIGSRPSEWELLSGAPEHVRVSSVWPNLRLGWSRSGVGTQQSERDADGRVGKGKGKGCFVCGRPGHAAEDCKFNHAKGKRKSHGKGKTKSTATDKNSPTRFEGESRHCGKKGHKWADCRKSLAEAKDKKVHAVDGAPSTATAAVAEDTGEIGEARICGDWSDDEDNRVDTDAAWVLSVEGDNKPVDAEFLPLHSACEEHTCPWNFAEGGRDWGPSNVQLRNANGLSIPSGKKVMVSYDFLGPRGLVKLHAQTPFVQSDVKRPLLSVGKLTQSSSEVKFGSKGSWIDLHTDSGVQRVVVRVKGETFASRSRKLMPGSSLRQVTQLHMQWWRRLMRRSAEPAPAAPEAEAAPRPEETQGMRLEQEARDLAAAWQSSRQLGQPLGEGGLEWQQRRRHAKPVEGAWRTGVGHDGSDVASTRPRRGKTRAPETRRGMACRPCQ